MQRLWDDIEDDPAHRGDRRPGRAAGALAGRGARVRARRLHALAAAGRPRRHRAHAAAHRRGRRRTRPSRQAVVSPASVPTSPDTTEMSCDTSAIALLSAAKRLRGERNDHPIVVQYIVPGGHVPNKAQFVEMLAERLDGDKKSAHGRTRRGDRQCLRRGRKGERVALTGFGDFRKARNGGARMARNPATGAAVRVKKTARAGLPRRRRVQGDHQRCPQARRGPGAAGGR